MLQEQRSSASRVWAGASALVRRGPPAPVAFRGLALGVGAVPPGAALSDRPGGSLGIALTTEPQGAYMIWLPAGGAKSPPSAATIARGEHYIRMEGKETYRFATRTLATTALESIRRAGIDPSDIDLFIPHQANIRIIEATARYADIPMEKVYVNVDRFGNMSSADWPALSVA